MGSLTGRHYRETMAEFPRRNWLGWQRSYWIAPPAGESLFDISDRVLTAFRLKVLPIAAHENVIVVCASDILRILVGYVTKTDESDIPKFDVQPAVPYVIRGEL
jgi:broad specificity phosphatase PhoE